MGKHPKAAASQPDSGVHARRRGAARVRGRCSSDRALPRALRDLVGRRDRRLPREDLLGEHAVNLGVTVCAAVGDDHGTVVGVCGVADRREDDAARGNPREHQGLDAAGPQDDLQVGSGECAHAVLRHADIARLGGHRGVTCSRRSLRRSAPTPGSLRTRGYAGWPRGSPGGSRRRRRRPASAPCGRLRRASPYELSIASLSGWPSSIAVMNIWKSITRRAQVRGSRRSLSGMMGREDLAGSGCRLVHRPARAASGGQRRSMKMRRAGEARRRVPTKACPPSCRGMRPRRP